MFRIAEEVNGKRLTASEGQVAEKSKDTLVDNLLRDGQESLDEQPQAKPLFVKRKKPSKDDDMIPWGKTDRVKIMTVTSRKANKSLVSGSSIAHPTTVIRSGHQKSLQFHNPLLNREDSIMHRRPQSNLFARNTTSRPETSLYITNPLVKNVVQQADLEQNQEHYVLYESRNPSKEKRHAEDSYKPNEILQRKLIRNNCFTFTRNPYFFGALKRFILNDMEYKKRLNRNDPKPASVFDAGQFTRTSAEPCRSREPSNRKCPSAFKYFVPKPGERLTKTMNSGFKSMIGRQSAPFRLSSVQTSVLGESGRPASRPLSNSRGSRIPKSATFFVSKHK